MSYPTIIRLSSSTGLAKYPLNTKVYTYFHWHQGFWTYFISLTTTIELIDLLLAPTIGLNLLQPAIGLILFPLTPMMKLDLLPMTPVIWAYFTPTYTNKWAYFTLNDINIGLILHPLTPMMGLILLPLTCDEMCCHHTDTKIGLI